ncbi:MAG: DHA2 family efflux MFS transporter permease subunit [Hyphomicrobiaceae bacterium]|nr:DHA2 family efflux MFS transporter permease subunit [Hyphomicrobiaceae bacterium]
MIAYADRGLTPAVQRGLITICVMMATIMQALDMTIANVALPYMQGSLSATLDQVSWVLTSYIVAAAIMTAPVGWLATRFGVSRVLVTCAIGFTAASMLCGVAQSVEQIVLYRVLQGMFGAALVPLSQSVMLTIFPPEKRAWAMSLWGMGVMIGPIMGPALGGWLTENYSWRWVFYINLPFGIATVVGLMALMRDQPSERRPPFDWMGFVTLSVAIGALQLMLDRGEQLGWFDSSEIVVEGLIALFAGYLFVAHTLTSSQPFVQIEIFKDRNFLIGLCYMFLAGILLLASAALLATYLQGIMGFPIVDAGYILGSRGVGMAAAMLLAGRLMGALGAQALLLAGLALSAAGLYESIYFSPDTTVSHLVWVGIVQGVGLGFMFVPLNTVALASLPPAYRTDGTVMWTLIRNLGSSIGVSVVIANLTNTTVLMRARLVESVTDFNAGLADSMAQQINPATETGRALLESIVNQQASIMAYANDFKLMFVMCLVAMPFVFLIRTPPVARSASPSPAAADVH